MLLVALLTAAEAEDSAEDNAFDALARADDAAADADCCSLV